MNISNENNSLQDEFISVSLIRSGVYLLPQQINSLTKLFLLLDYDNDRKGLSSLWHVYVLNLCSFLEGLLRLTYNDYLTRNINKISDNQHLHLLEESKKVLQTLPWEKLRKSATLYLEEQLPADITSSSSFKTVCLLFKLRNSIVHGNDFEIDIICGNNSYRYEVSGKAKEVYKYLIEKELLSAAELENLDYYELNPKSVHFFIKETYVFTKKYLKYITSKTDFDYLKQFEESGFFNGNHNKLLNSK